MRIQDLHRPGRPTIMPAIHALKVRSFGPWRHLDWSPDPGVNLIESPSSYGASALCSALIRATLPDLQLPPLFPPAELAYAPRPIAPSGRSLRPNSKCAGREMGLKDHRDPLPTLPVAALMTVQPWQAVVLDCEVTGNLNEGQLCELASMIEATCAQLLIFAVPRVFPSLASGRSTKWRISRERFLQVLERRSPGV